MDLTQISPVFPPVSWFWVRIPHLITFSCHVLMKVLTQLFWCCHNKMDWQQWKTMWFWLLGNRYRTPLPPFHPWPSSDAPSIPKSHHVFHLMLEFHPALTLSFPSLEIRVGRRVRELGITAWWGHVSIDKFSSRERPCVQTRLPSGPSVPTLSVPREAPMAILGLCPDGLTNSFWGCTSQKVPLHSEIQRAKCLNF